MMGTRIRRSTLAGACTVLALMVAAVPAHAEVRGALIGDAQDATPTVSGVPTNPDINTVGIVYDSTVGSLTISVNFYNSIEALDTSENYAFWSNFRVGRTTPPPSPGGESTCTGELVGQNHIKSVYSTFVDQAEISGYSGKLPFTRTTSPDGKAVTIAATSAALQNHDWTCFRYSLNARTRSAAGNTSQYDEACACWYVVGPIDVLGAAGPTVFEPSLWFTGFAPPPPAKVETAAEMQQKAAEKREAEAAAQRKLAEETLAKPEAEKIVRAALRHRFHGKINRFTLKVDCAHQESKKERTCKIAFETGPHDRRLSVHGSASVWLTRTKTGQIKSRYAWELSGVDRSCRREGHSVKRCTRHPA